MKQNLLHSVVLVAALVATSSTTAHADPVNKPISSKSNVGWGILALSFVAGATLTTISATVTCAPNETECGRWTSLGIWGGVGIASAGAVAGLLLIKADARPARVRVSLAVDRSQAGAATPRATLVCAF